MSSRRVCGVFEAEEPCSPFQLPSGVFNTLDEMCVLGAYEVVHLVKFWLCKAQEPEFKPRAHIKK